MRKLLLLIVAGLVIIPTTATAAPTLPMRGGGGVVRTDQADSADVLDIYQVGTDLAARRTFFGVSGWDFFRAGDINARRDSYFQFILDTRNRSAPDRYVGLYYWPPDGAFYCEVQDRFGQVNRSPGCCVRARTDLLPRPDVLAGHQQGADVLGRSRPLQHQRG